MGLKLKIHWTFVLLAFYYGVAGRLFTFLIYTFSAIIHEMGHSYMAQSQGYKLNKVVVMPFGAVVTGDTKFMRAKEELKIAFAGPFTSFCVAVAFVSLWWFLPQTYAYTDLVVDANLTLATVNLLPIMPLDGGRIMLSFLSVKLGREKARKIVKIVGYILSGGLLSIAVVSCFFYFNLSMIIFALFAFIGQFMTFKDNNYVYLWSGLVDRKLKNGSVYKKIALDKGVTVKKAIKMLDFDCVNEVVVFSDGQVAKTLCEKQLVELAEDGGFNKTLGETLRLG